MLNVFKFLIFLPIAVQIMPIHSIGLINSQAEYQNYSLVSDSHRYKPEDLLVMEFLGLSQYGGRLQRRLSLRSSASKFLLEVYNLVIEEDSDLDNIREYLSQTVRQKRSLLEENFITAYDRLRIQNCNNIITFASKKIAFDKGNLGETPIASDLELNFNTKDVAADLQLIHSVLRIYQLPKLSKFAAMEGDKAVITVSIYQRSSTIGQDLNILTSTNTSNSYQGWLEFNITNAVGRWLQQKASHSHQVLVGVSIDSASAREYPEILPSHLGLVGSQGVEGTVDLQPFVIAYFDGPDLLRKIQRSRFRRELLKRKTKYNPPEPKSTSNFVRSMNPCNRHNFTLNFKDIYRSDWVISPKQFQAYYCGGDCNFPLGSHMNATNHAIVQTLMHLKKSHIPKPCCVPTALGSISILHFVNEDSVNLTKYPQSVAKECGCH